MIKIYLRRKLCFETPALTVHAVYIIDFTLFGVCSSIEDCRDVYVRRTKIFDLSLLLH
jgi:hypothetical protein